MTVFGSWAFAHCKNLVDYVFSTQQPDKRESSVAIDKTNNDLSITSITQIEDSANKRVEDEQVPDHILAESCGNVNLNGIYRKVPGVFHCGVPVYIKKGSWNGNKVAGEGKRDTGGILLIFPLEMLLFLALVASKVVQGGQYSKLN